MQYKYLLILLLFITAQITLGLPATNSLNFKTSGGHNVKVFKRKIYYDNKIIGSIKYPDDILYQNKANRLIEDRGSEFLFIAMAGNPTLNRLIVFSITPAKATQTANAILSPVKDYDHDGYLEFGGSDLTEAYGQPDSMYYLPTNYYEIREGKIRHDNALTRREDIRINGLYLPPGKQMDDDGNCCKVVPKRGRTQ